MQQIEPLRLRAALGWKIDSVTQVGPCHCTRLELYRLAAVSAVHPLKGFCCSCFLYKSICAAPLCSTVAEVVQEERAKAEHHDVEASTKDDTCCHPILCAESKLLQVRISYGYTSHIQRAVGIALEFILDQGNEAVGEWVDVVHPYPMGRNLLWSYDEATEDDHEQDCNSSDRCGLVVRGEHCHQHLEVLCHCQVHDGTDSHEVEIMQAIAVIA
mmetsp:Transcript_33421/g.76370  ORF Transcript_33421/g.76370 Transcript_33421/m.76370 type:complete len:214 (+) Transcript_33421:1812-2453(+)